MPDILTCGYQRVTSLCREPRNVTRCIEHEQLRWVVCAGCGGLAGRECPGVKRLVDDDASSPCRMPLCETCVHGPDGTHEPPGSEAFTPPPSPAAEQAKDQANTARAELLSATSKAVMILQERGLLRVTTPEGADRVAAELLNELGAMVVLQILQGIVRGSDMLGGAR